MWRLLGLLLALYGAFDLSPACVSDTNYIGIVLNSGEPINYQKIELLGKNEINFFKKPGLSLFDSILIRSAYIDTLYVPSVTLLSQDFQYDPFAIQNIETEPLCLIVADTLIITDYWAITEQPQFHCSTTFSNDTLHIFYNVSSGNVNDWSPEVKTTLKFRINADDPNSHPFIALYFHKAPYARKSAIARVRDATTDSIIKIPIVNFSFSYRAHSDTTLLISLDYQYSHGLYRGTPMITIYSDPQIAYSTKELLVQFQKELTWLTKEGICAITAKTSSFVDSSGTMFGGGIYWTKQDTILEPYSWFNSETEISHAYVDGCGSTDFNLPQNSLSANSSNINSHSIVKKLTKNQFSVKTSQHALIVASDIPFDNFKVFNATGKQILFGQSKGKFKTKIELSGIRNQFRSGLYFIEIRRGNNTILRSSFTLQ